MHLQPLYRDAPMLGGAVAEEVFARGICLPSSTFLTDEDIDRIANVIGETIRSKGEAA